MGDFISAIGNPWSADQWNVTKQGEFLLRYGQRRAEQFAKEAGTTVGGAKPDGVGPKTIVKVLIQKRVINQGGTGGGIIGAGSSGDGPPEG